jgi:hypothetical protein
MADQSFIAQFFAGTFSRKALLTILIPAIVTALLAPAFVSGLLYPHPYDWRYIVLSALSSRKENPNAYFLTPAGGIIAGIVMIGFLGYYQKKLGKICRGSTGVGTAFMLVGVVGLILLGVTELFDIRIEKSHEYLAAFGFLGVVLAAPFYGCPILKDRLRGAKQFNMQLFWATSIALIIPVVGMAAGAIIGSDLPPGYEAVDYVILHAGELLFPTSFAFWEWLLFFGVLVYVVCLAILVPENIIPFKKAAVQPKAT